MNISTIDWCVLSMTLLFIVGYGYWKTNKMENIDDYVLGGKEAKWWTVGLSVMATQASAITFLSTPGQAFHDGMGFVQFYFGLPIAMIVICVTFIPIFHRLKVYTAYEYLESRFDLKTRSLTAFLFLLQRGLAAGITIYAPAIILSTILGWNLNLTNFIIGILVIIYTVSGGTKAVNVTQKQQMAVIFLGLVLVFFIILNSFPEEVSIYDALQVAGANGKMNILDFSFDPSNRYTVWTGLTGGFFLMLAYFGTDQSQVQRYLSAESIKESRMGLMMNGLLKIPMQFFILLIGVMVFVFYQFNSNPVFFNPTAKVALENTEYQSAYESIENEHADLLAEKETVSLALARLNSENSAGERAKLILDIGAINDRDKVIRSRAKEVIKAAAPSIETNDKDYVFIHFILTQLPKGVIGLLLAMILSAAMSSTASELNALGTTTLIDIYKRSIHPDGTDMHYVKMGRILTMAWGIIAIIFACYGSLFENLIQLVNIIGSIFYGTILGIFLCAFYFKFIKSNAVFFGAIIAECCIIAIWYADTIGFLWLNLIGCVLVFFFATILQLFLPSRE